MTRTPVAAAHAADAGTRRIAVEDFSEFGGRHCESASLRKLLRHHGYDFSEELLFGLGGGAGFMHWLSPGMDRPFLGGRNGRFPDFSLRAAAGVGQRAEVVRGAADGEAYERLVAELKDGLPVICFGDIYHLPYFQAVRHFGGHAFVVYGIDEPADRALISDRGTSVRYVTLAQLSRACGSLDPPFPAGNSQLRVRVASDARVDEAALLSSIRGSCSVMLHPPMPSFGLAGLRGFHDRVAGIVAGAPATQVVDCLVSAYIDLELAGTGGRAFRVMYSEFLREAADRLDSAVLRAALPLADDAVGAWGVLIDDLLMPLGDGMRAIKATLHERERIFEHGTSDETHHASHLCEQLSMARAQAASEVASSRAALATLGPSIDGVHDAEARLFGALSEV